MIHHIPSLKILDYSKVTQSERDRATRLAQSAAGASLERDVQQEKTFEPGQGKSAGESFATSFTKEQKEAIRQMVSNAKSPEEIEAIELSVQRGIFPGAGTTSGSTPPVVDEQDGNVHNGKRPAEQQEDGDVEESRAKRSRAEES